MECAPWLRFWEAEKYPQLYQRLMPAVAVVLALLPACHSPFARSASAVPLESSWTEN